MFFELILALTRFFNAKAAYYATLAAGMKAVTVPSTDESESTSSEGLATTMGAGGAAPIKQTR